ncbi:cob(I)yrinic acid a,c-diamide adenosyltransferase [bacterium]|nr:cob(I)yrinic acid a,c-diamide adenosyltransferase [bacterium]
MALRITKVYTKQGDDGTTRLGGGQEVSKDTARIHTYGTVDELNSVIGIALSFELTEIVQKTLIQVQHQLFTLGGELCVLEEDRKKWEMKEIAADDVERLEQLMDTLNEELQPLEEFILPGGGRVASFLHQARCVCRRAERLAVGLAESESVSRNVIKYLNRLSDALFVMARYENHKRGVKDVYWKK